MGSKIAIVSMLAMLLLISSEVLELATAGGGGNLGVGGGLSGAGRGGSPRGRGGFPGGGSFQIKGFEAMF